MTISATAPIRFVVLLTAVAVALLLLLSGALVTPAEAGTGSDVVTPVVHHEVRSGDTLWSIAAGFTPPDDDIRATIHEIRTVNGLSSSVIEVGQVLVIPVEF